MRLSSSRWRGALFAAALAASNAAADPAAFPANLLTAANAQIGVTVSYDPAYVRIAYPGGDVPRTEGVCSDTVIRALRNAGIDLQKEVHEDILRARAAYPMVEKVDPSINHRRVRTLLPWFARHFDTLPKGTRYLPGDIVFFDTFPSKPGPDHLGVVSDRRAENGQPYVINNWTDHSAKTNTSAPVALVAGTKYSVVMEYYERTGKAVARLRWAYPGQSTQVIPQARLYP